MSISAVLAIFRKIAKFWPMVPPCGQNFEIPETAEIEICCAEFHADQKYVKILGRNSTYQLLQSICF